MARRGERRRRRAGGAATGAVIGEADVATRFVVRDGRIAELERHDALGGALRAAGLTEADASPES
jgi:hypothetical protein